jgi:hypothetical protein
MIAALHSPLLMHPLQRWQWIAIFLTLMAAAVLIFARLSTYALWDDEANTALIGQSVWRTGDTVAKIGDNIIAFRGGGDLVNLRTRYIPPGQFYLAAPFVGLAHGPNTFLARFPFAVLGLGAVALMLLFLKLATDDPVMWLVACIAIVSNVSLILYVRQSRYYAMAICATVAMVMLYQFWNGRWWQVTLFVLSSLILLSSNYLNFAALYGCLLIDYLIWGRKRIRVSFKQLIGLIVPQLIVGAVIVGIWDPIGKEVTGVTERETLAQKLTLRWWNIRDINMAEFCSIPLLIVGVVIYFVTPREKRNSLLVRGPLALVIYNVVVTAASPQRLKSSYVADVRYLAPTIPIALAASVVAVAALSRRRLWLAAILAILAFATNLTHGGTYGSFGMRDPATVHVDGFSSAIASYIGELIHPAHDPYTPTARWILQNVPPGASIWCVPEYTEYPLMYYAPQYIYAWQLAWPPQEQFKDLPRIHFRGQMPPDYIIAFGPVRQQVVAKLTGPANIRYVLAARINTYYRDRYRPELFWHVFETKPVTDPETQQIYIYRLEQAQPDNSLLHL